MFINPQTDLMAFVVVGLEQQNQKGFLGEETTRIRAWLATGAVSRRRCWRHVHGQIHVAESEESRKFDWKQVGGGASTRRVWCQSGTEMVEWQKCHPDSLSHFCRLDLWSEWSTFSSLPLLLSAVRAWMGCLGVSQWSCGIFLDLLLVFEDHFLREKEHD